MVCIPGPCTVTRFPRLSCSHHRAIFPGGFSPVVSWRATGYRWPMPLKLFGDRFQFAGRIISCLPNAAAASLPLAGNSQFPANSAISCCVCLSHNPPCGTLYFVRPSFRSTERKESVLRRTIRIATWCNLIVVAKTVNAIYNNDF